jgi:hypothetical protein
MTLNMSKTWEMVIRGRTTKPLPFQLDAIERKNWLKLLAMAFQDDPCCWHLQVDTLLSKAASRMYMYTSLEFADPMVKQRKT